MQYRVLETAWGYFGFVADDDGLVATWLPDAANAIRDCLLDRFPQAGENPRFMPEFAGQVRAYFDGKSTTFTVPLNLDGTTKFQKAVLKACHKVPFGKTVTYAQLAAKVGQPKAARAVGGVMARNPMPLVIPCHRVLRSDESLGGFSSPGGVSQKARMLHMEGAAAKGMRAGKVA